MLFETGCEADFVFLFYVLIAVWDIHIITKALHIISQLIKHFDSPGNYLWIERQFF